MQHVQQSEGPAPALHTDKHQINNSGLGWALLSWFSFAVNCLRLKVSYRNKWSANTQLPGRQVGIAS